nr:unnamed protein product [Spirometra erinaceieuropaei]
MLVHVARGALNAGTSGPKCLATVHVASRRFWELYRHNEDLSTCIGVFLWHRELNNICPWDLLSEAPTRDELLENKKLASVSSFWTSHEVGCLYELAVNMISTQATATQSSKVGQLVFLLH